MHRKILLLISLAVLALPVSSLSAQCLSRTSDVKQFWRDSYNNSDVNKNLAGYGVIFDEADTDECAADAAVALYQKVSDTLNNNWPARDIRLGDDLHPVYVGAYGGWLEGANVGLVYATALNLSRHGKLTAALDNLLMRIDYQLHLDPGCGLGNGAWDNSCMDDYALAAHAWAWQAAYENLAGHDPSQSIGNAHTAIDNALSPIDGVCIYDSAAHGNGSAITDSRGPCSLSISLLSNPDSVFALGLHNGDRMGYGLGLMTSIASASAGLEVAGSPLSLNADQVTVADALRKNAQRHTDRYGSPFDKLCYGLTNLHNGTLQVVTNVDCADVGYLPTMFPISEFYNRYVGASADGVFAFNQWDGTPFSNAVLNGNGDANFFNAGRRAVYRTLGYYWINYRPILTGNLELVSLRSYNGNYLQAVNSGGSYVDATSTNVGAYQQFGMLDINGGTLNDGDTVWMQVENGNWVTAVNGGGPGSALNANSGDPLAPETFVVQKLNGTGAIVNGDSIALRSSNGYYVVAEGGGGSVVNCDRTSPGPWETFTYTKY